MRIKLLASTAAPTSISNLSRPLARHRFIPRPAKQHGDTAFDADPESLRFLECGAALQRFLLRSLFPAPLRDAHLADLSLMTALHIVDAVETAISCVTFGRVLEGLLVTLQEASTWSLSTGFPFSTR